MGNVFCTFFFGGGFFLLRIGFFVFFVIRVRIVGRGDLGFELRRVRVN